MACQAIFQAKTQAKTVPIELPPCSTLDKSNTRRLGIVAVSVSLVAAVLLVLCLYIFVKCRQERYKKRQAIKVRGD